MLEGLKRWLIEKLGGTYGRVREESPVSRGVRSTDTGYHSNGAPHVIGYIGRLPNEALYICKCGAQLIFEGDQYRNSEGYVGVKFPFNPFSPSLDKLPPNWRLGEELKQLDSANI